jgi:peptidyl-prolyl cis-trans isomerase A (cyclophilin A)
MRKLLAVMLLASVAFAQTAKSTTKTTSTTKKTTTTSDASTAKNPTAVIHTTAGDLTCTLDKDKVPNAVNNFVGLATGTKDWTDPKTGNKAHGKPLYDGTIFHRVIPEFMIQGGDPLGTGTGDPGYKIPDEFSPDLNFANPGVLAYANSGPNTNGSQFFITEVPVPFLDPCLDEAGCMRGPRRVRKGYGYTIFGQCTPETVELVKKIAREPRGPSDRPDKPVRITHISITGAGATTAHKPAIKKPASTKTDIKKPGESTPPKQQ